MTPDELRARLTITVEEAANALGLGRSAAYEACRRGELPTLRLGRRLLVPTGPLLELVGHGGGEAAEDGPVGERGTAQTGRSEVIRGHAAPDPDSGAQVVELR